MEKLDVAKIKDKKILAIGAHPDDLEFGVGGTLLLLGKHNRIEVVSVTSGQMGSHDEDENKGDLISTREEEQREASKMYGASPVFFLGMADMFVSDEFKRLRKKMVKLFVKRRPDIVITHDPWKQYFPYHPDHRATGFAVYDALIASTLPQYLAKRSVAGKPLFSKPQLWLMHPNLASHAVDITTVYKQKIAAIETHTSQFDEVVVWNKIAQKLEAHFRKVGEEIGSGYAEPIRIVEN